MAAKKATKKVAKKKVASKKSDEKKKVAKVQTDKKSAKKAAKPEKATEKKAKPVDVVESTETPSTMVVAAEKPEKKKKKLTKKQIAEQSEQDELTEKWSKLKAIDHEIKLQKYKMTEVYQANSPIEHPVFGWGFVLSLNENKLEVLFESGIKMLVSNYKG